MKIKIIKCSQPNLWYANAIGQEFTVKKTKTGYTTGFGKIMPTDLVIINNDIKHLKKIVRQEIARSERQQIKFVLSLKERREALENILLTLDN